MIPPSLSVSDLVEYGRKRLKFSLQAGEGGLGDTLRSSSVEICTECGGGSTELLPLHSIVVMTGSAPNRGAQSLNGLSCSLLGNLRNRNISLVVYATAGSALSSDVRQFADSIGLPFATSVEDPWYIKSRLRAFLRERLEGTIYLHGVLMKVFGMGLLILGKSGAGKSSCARHLISRGHQLVADDMVEMRRDQAGHLWGGCPAPIKDLLEIPGIGIINARKLFGFSAVCGWTMIDVVFQLKTVEEDSTGDTGCLSPPGCLVCGGDIWLIKHSVNGGESSADIADIMERASRREMVKRFRRGSNQAAAGSYTCGGWR